MDLLLQLACDDHVGNVGIAFAGDVHGRVLECGDMAREFADVFRG